MERQHVQVSAGLKPEEEALLQRYRKLSEERKQKVKAELDDALRELDAEASSAVAESGKDRVCKTCG